MALHNSTVNGLWVVHGTKSLKFLPGLTEAEKSNQIK